MTLSATEFQLAVLKELKAVRKASLGKLDSINQKTGSPWLTALELDRAARTLDGYHDRMTRSQAIKLLLECEIAKIATHPCCAWLPASFGLSDETHGKDPTECRKIAQRISGEFSQNKFERSDGGIEQEGLSILAAQIVADCLHDSEISAASSSTTSTARNELPVRTRPEEFNLSVGKGRRGKSIVPVQKLPEPTLGSSDKKPDGPGPGSYVSRRDVHQEFARAIEQGARIIAFKGYEGFGKTRLALALAATGATGRSASIEVHSDEIPFNELVSELLRLDVVSEIGEVGIEPISPGQKSMLFGALINSAKAPDYLVLDCVRTNCLPLELGNLANARSRIVITCLPGFQLPDSTHVINVGPLTQSESFSLFNRNSSLAHDIYDGSWQLVGELRGYPPAILHAARLVSESHVPIHDVVHTVRSRPDIFYQNIPRSTAALQDSLKEIINATGGEDWIAIHLLESMIFLERTNYISRDFLKTYTNFIGADNLPAPTKFGSSTRSFEFNFALHKLVTLQLVEATSNGQVMLQPTLRAAIRPFVQDNLWTVIRNVLAFCENTAVVAGVLHGEPFDPDAIRQSGVNPAEILCSLYHVLDVLEEATMLELPPPEIAENEMSLVWTYCARAKSVIKSQPDIEIYFKGEDNASTWTYRG